MTSTMPGWTTTDDLYAPDSIAMRCQDLTNILLPVLTPDLAVQFKANNQMLMVKSTSAMWREWPTKTTTPRGPYFDAGAPIVAVGVGDPLDGRWWSLTDPRPTRRTCSPMRTMGDGEIEVVHPLTAGEPMMFLMPVIYLADHLTEIVANRARGSSRMDLAAAEGLARAMATHFAHQ